MSYCQVLLCTQTQKIKCFQSVRYLDPNSEVGRALLCSHYVISLCLIPQIFMKSTCLIIYKIATSCSRFLQAHVFTGTKMKASFKMNLLFLLLHGMFGNVPKDNTLPGELKFFYPCFYFPFKRVHMPWEDMIHLAVYRRS